MLSESDIMKCLNAAGCYGNVKMTFESGPYCIDRPTIKASRFAEQIESAACAERDARIAELVNTIEKGKDLMGGMALKVAELEQKLAEARKQMEAQKDEWLSWEAKRRDLEKDAERYRWLREDSVFCNLATPHPWPVWGTSHEDAFPIWKSDLDASIDAARAAIKEQT